MIQCDVAILGAGPAGAALAAALAGAYQVVLIDRWDTPPEKIGESLVPAARRILRDLRLLDAVEARGYAPYYGNVAYWGSDLPAHLDFIADPDGPGWHLDRADFDLLLRNAALARGAVLLAPARLGQMQREADNWHLTAETQCGTHALRAKILVDASGRSSVVGKRLGIPRRLRHSTVAHWLKGTDSAAAPDAGRSTVAATQDGWWYTASVNPKTGHRVLALHCDAKRSVTDLMREAAPAPIRAILKEAGFTPDGLGNRTAAGTAMLSQAAGRGWLSVGDAGLAMDPLSSRGIYHALYTGLAGAAACDHALRSAESDFADYADHIAVIGETYMRDLGLFYQSETRWPAAPFWSVRSKAPLPA